jgi:hypothetical protein
VTDTHDGALRLAGDGVLRGAIADPTGAPHAAAYSPLHDRNRPEGASLCGACHDVRTTAGVDVERTYAEWQTTVFARPEDPDARTCGGCHMPAHDGPVTSLPGARARSVHDHSMAAVDVALGTWPETEAQRLAVQQSLDSALVAKLCVRAPGSVDVTLENARVGHAWPTGAAHDRRVWLELVAYSAGARVWSSGAGDHFPSADSDVFALHATLLDGRQTPVPFLWDAAAIQTRALGPTVTRDPADPAYAHARTAHFTTPLATDRVTMRVRMEPVGADVLAELTGSGDLDPTVASRAPAYALVSTTLEWTADRGFGCLP